MQYTDKDNDNLADEKGANGSDVNNDIIEIAEHASGENSGEDSATIVELEQQKLLDLEAKVAELKDLFIRSQAEVQNIKKRSIDEVKKARDYAISSFAKDIVTVKDYLEMALKDESGDVNNIKTGVDLTLKQLVQIFERQMIKEINTNIKDKLDPHLHQAMQTVEQDGFEPNTIVSIMQKGYMLNDRVIRPAMVVVAK